jgi:hypothetical protein
MVDIVEYNVNHGESLIFSENYSQDAAESKRVKTQSYKLTGGALFCKA